MSSPQQHDYGFGLNESVTDEMMQKANLHSMESELAMRRRFMDRNDARACDIPACNCNSWHWGANSWQARYEEMEQRNEELIRIAIALRRHVVCDAIGGIGDSPCGVCNACKAIAAYEAAKPDQNHGTWREIMQ